MFKSEELTVLANWGRASESSPTNPGCATIRDLLTVKHWLEVYVQHNYTGPPVNQETLDKLKDPDTIEDHNQDPGDGESFVENIQARFLVWNAAQTLDRLIDCVQEYPSIRWWLVRTLFLKQKCLDEKSSSIWSSIQDQITQLEPIFANTNIGDRLSTLGYVEFSEIFAYYYDIDSAKKYLEKGKESYGITTNTTGVLGKRTKFQQTKVAQLILNVEVDLVKHNDFKETEQQGYRPITVVPLEDEDRLDKLQLESSPTGTLSSDLGSLHHFLILAEYSLLSKHLPPDGVYLEELLAYLNYLIESPNDFCVQVVSLCQRSVLEVNNRRTVERSMKQLEVLQKAVQNCDSHEDPLWRCRYYFGSGMPLRLEIEVYLARVLNSLHLFKESLEIALRLNLWEDVISCYTHLNLRHKAEQVIRDKINLQPNSVKLWILLGDATDLSEHYAEAWKVSGEKSARAQRQWGYYYFVRKEYAQAIPHLLKSIELNPLEYPTWIRLGYAALAEENWALSTKAYQHASALDGDNFEIWNNLAHGFVKLKENHKALRALKEASKCNYENWKVWENTLVVATQCKAFDEVLRAYNRLLDLKSGKWADEQVLQLLVQAIVTNIPDAQGKPCRDKYYKEGLKLFGRVTSIVTNNPKIWKLYSDLLLIDDVALSGTDSNLNWTKGLGFAQKALEQVMSDGKFINDSKSLQEVVDFTLEYIERTNELCSKYGTFSEVVTKAEFTIRRVYATIKKRRDTIINPDGLEKYLDQIKLKAHLLKVELS